MINHELVEICQKLRLQNLANLSKTNQLGNEQHIKWLINLLKQEVEVKRNKKIARLYQQARFPKRKTLDDYIWHEQINF